MAKSLARTVARRMRREACRDERVVFGELEGGVFLPRHFGSRRYRTMAIASSLLKY